MRLAIVVDTFPEWSQTFIVSKVTGLREAGLDVTVVTQRGSADYAMFAHRLSGNAPRQVDGDLAVFGRKFLVRQLASKMMCAPGVSWDLWRRVRARNHDTGRTFRTWLQALPLVSGRYDVIHFEYSGLAVSYLEALPFLAPAKLVISCRGSDERVVPLVDSARAQELRQVFSRVNKIHCVSADLQRTVEQYGARPDQVFVNRPAVRVAEFRREEPYPVKEQGPYRLLSVGRLHWRKGFDYGFLAVRQLVDTGCDVQYDIVGEGPDRERLAYRIHELELASHVRLRERRPASEVRAALAEADVFVLPSLTEGVSNAALEAMAMELPVVATTAGGMSEAIVDGCEGFLVPPRQPMEIADRVRRLLDSPALRGRMGQAGRRRVLQDFNSDKQIQRFVAEYQTMLDA